jgi:hypothetical protein
MNLTERYLISFAAAALTTLAVAWIAFHLQQSGVAPVLVFPILVGAALGVALAAIARTARVPARRAAAIGAVCWGLLAAVAQDYIGHRVRLRQYDDELADKPLAAALVHEVQLRPTFGAHLKGKLQAQPVWWTLDLLLTAASAGLVVAIAPLAAGPNVSSETLSPGGRGRGEGE